MGGRATSSLRHNDLSAVGLIPRSIEAWRSGRSKYAAIVFLVTTMGSEDARLASPVFLLGKILEGRGACKDCQSSTRKNGNRYSNDTPQGEVLFMEGRRSLLRRRTGREGGRRVTNLAALGGAMEGSAAMLF